jgi:hypothetical protein
MYTENRSMPMLACYLAYFGLMFLVLRWWKPTEPARTKRFSVKPLIATGFCAFALLFLLPSVQHRHTAFVAMLSSAAVLQLVSPWRERVRAVSGKKRRFVEVERVGRLAT